MGDIGLDYSGQWRMRVPKSMHASLVLRAKLEGVSLNLFASTLLANGLARRHTKESEDGSNGNIYKSEK